MNVVVIGGGHNGLTAAAILAKAGRRVLVLEARHQVGGLCAREIFADGYAVPGILHDTRCVRSEVVKKLDLERFGLRRQERASSICAPRSDGEPVWIDADGVRGVPASDEEAFARHRAFINRVALLIRHVFDHMPSDPTSDPWSMLKTALRVRRLGQRDMFELLRIAPMCVGDLMRDLFTSERLCAALSLPAIQGAFMGPWSAGTAANLLRIDATAQREIVGGGAALSQSLLMAATHHGAEIRTDAAVGRILTGDGGVRGVELEGGERIEATQVLTTCDPKQVFLRLIGSHRIDTELAHDIRSTRARGTTCKMHLALSGPLLLADGTEIEILYTGETLDDLERSFDCIKYDQFAERPVLDVRVPSIRDPDLVTPKGHHVVSIMAHSAPINLEGGWSDRQRDALGDAIVHELARYCPALHDQIVMREVLTPRDLEENYRLTGGHIYHLEHAFDQMLFMRPSVDCFGYATPIPGLFLGGSGSHPGGGITCMPGALAAQTVLQSRR